MHAGYVEKWMEDISLAVVVISWKNCGRNLCTNSSPDFEKQADTSSMNFIVAST